ncbi:MAG: type II CRISPR RNA-guided endonuclease Cas9 [Verrucomicrobiota bacterium]
MENNNGGLEMAAGFESLNDPIALRLRALNGDSLKPEELHTALAHLFRRRGYTEVPWKNRPDAKEDGDAKKELGEIKSKMSNLQTEMHEAGCKFPAQLLAKRKAAGASQRREVWPRELLEAEFRAIVAAQTKQFPKLAEKADWLLHGDPDEINRNGNTFHVFFKTTESRNPGVVGLRWPRFDNRGPTLDSFQPVDNEGRPLHVVRKNKQAFIKAQWELALMNFRVLDCATNKLISPDLPSLLRLREIWENSKRTKKKKNSEVGESENVSISESVLKKWAKEYVKRYKLVEGQTELTPQSGAGRARYCSPTLELLQKEISAGRRIDPPQPILKRSGENTQRALDRYLSDIKHPLVRHRLILFRRLLAKLTDRFGTPDTIVVEAVRSLALSQKNKNELNKRNEQFRKERQNAREELSSTGESTSRRALLRYRLWQEAKGRCPFCLETIERTALGHGADIEHLVPRSIVDCNEAYNLTVAHIKCNRELKGDRIPFTAFGGTTKWSDLKSNAEKSFKGRKLEIFVSANAEELIEQKADLAHTAYIARVLRHIALIQLGWLNNEGRDPTPEKQNSALRFQVSNGQLTSRLRKAWGLNQILHPLPPGKRWDELSPEDQMQFTEKNRGDLRHHALDAMVIVCTLPWLARRTHGAKDEFGRHGWWTQDEKQRSKAANPLFPGEGQMHDVVKKEIQKVVVQHHVSRSNHQQAYATTLYSKKTKDTYVARETFTTLTPKNLGSIWPKEFAAYCETAWNHYSDETANLESELKKTKGCVPENFTRKLCFSHFQNWRAKGGMEFSWPEKVKIPIRNVRLISVKDDTAVVPFSPGTHAYVKRTGFKEVRIHLAEDGKSFVPVFVPYWKNDTSMCPRPIKQDSKPVAVIRRGMVVETKKPFATGQPVGKYRVLVTGQVQLKLLPHHVANKEETIISFGFGKKGLQPVWSDFIRCLGYELPHTPSSQPSSAGAAEA